MRRRPFSSVPGGANHEPVQLWAAETGRECGALPLATTSHRRARLRGCSPAVRACSRLRTGPEPDRRPRGPLPQGPEGFSSMCSGPEIETASAEDALRRWRPNRRTLVKAGATFTALAATFGATRGEPDRVTAQQGQSSGSGSTNAQRWSADEQAGSVAAADADGYRIAQAGFPFYALGASWEGSFGSGATLEFRFSTGGAFGEPVFTSAAVEDGYRPNRDGRIFTHLVFVNGATAVQYRALDGAGDPIVLPGFELVFIDATDGPSAGDNVVTAAGGPTLQKPTVVSRS